MLAEVRSAKDAQKLTALAAAAEYYARKANLGQEAISYAHTIRIDAQVLLGGYLKAAEKNVGAKGIGTSAVPDGNRTTPPTLADLGVSKKLSSESQHLATIAKEWPEELQAIRMGGKSVGGKTITEVRRDMKRAEVKRGMDLPDAKFRVLYADPPWKYGDQLTEDYGPTKFHYPAMTISELCALPVEDLCEPDAVLFLWVTSPMLEDAFPVIKAWRFEYKTSFVWDKMKHNLGHYNSVRHEFLLVCTRGSCLPDVPQLFDSVQSIERTEHSVKPERFRTIIDTIYPHGKRLELFARREAEGWERWGNQT